MNLATFPFKLTSTLSLHPGSDHDAWNNYLHVDAAFLSLHHSIWKQREALIGRLPEGPIALREKQGHKST